MRYLVKASAKSESNFAGNDVQILDTVVLPSFAMLANYEIERTILAGGLPVGERSLVMIAEADSNEELDQVLRSLPLWDRLEWSVTPLNSFKGRADVERAARQRRGR